MQTVSGTPYFTGTKNPIKQFPYLTKDCRAEVLIIGGGIDGAIATHALTQAGRQVMVIDKGRFGWGSTAAATALLEYQLDDFADDLTGELTETQIVQIYRQGLKGIEVLEDFVGKHSNRCHFYRRPTMVFSSLVKDRAKVVKEFEFRKRNHFSVQLLEAKNNPFPFTVEAGIFCPNGGAECDPYLLTGQLLECSEQRGATLYEHTRAVTLKPSGMVLEVTTEYGVITAQKVVVATGYDYGLFTHKKLCTMHHSYSIVTSPIPHFNWYKKTLLHDTMSPYHYLRTTHDGRLILGGEDTPFKKSLSPADAQKKYELLETYLLQLFPELKNRYTIDYRFCGAFASTKNNLGVIGTHETMPNVTYFFGYGADGILNCLYASTWLNDVLNHKETEFTNLFGVTKRKQK